MVTMNKCALYIPRPGTTSQMVQRGYVDVLRHLGWNVYIGDPKTKLNCHKLIEDKGIGLIMTHSRYGMRQLPINTINANQVMVFVEAIPLNNDELTIDGPYEMAHSDELDVVQSIQSVVVHTNIEPHLWTTYMALWGEGRLVHIPVAGNLIQAVPPTCSILTDVAMVANFTHRQSVMRCLIKPLFKRLEMLGHSYQAFGDDIWAKAGLNYNGPLEDDSNKLAHIYATAHICPNVHTEQQVGLQACVNDRSFMIPLCGGVQVSDNPLITRYLGSHCLVATSVTDFINKVIDNIGNQSQRFEQIEASVEYVAKNHTYFNRLVDLFQLAGWHDLATAAEAEGRRMAIKHCWEINARLNAEERGVPYEHQVVGTS